MSEPMNERDWLARVLREPAPNRAQLDELLRQYARASSELGHDSACATRIRQRIVEVNLRLVMTVANRIKRLPRGWDVGDVVACGAVGLDEAVRRFDPERGFAFSTYALWWVRHSIFRTMADLGHVVRIPVHAQEAARKPKNQRQERLRDEVDAARSTYSLDVVDGSRTTLGDMLSDERALSVDDAMALGGDVEFVRDALELLPEPERQVIELRFFQGLSLKEVGARLGISREWARQAEFRALARIRAKLVA
jgi:RNA polymerase primary sigma factor